MLCLPAAGRGNPFHLLKVERGHVGIRDDADLPFLQIHPAQLFLQLTEGLFHYNIVYFSSIHMYRNSFLHITVPPK